MTGENTDSIYGPAPEPKADLHLIEVLLRAVDSGRELARFSESLGVTRKEGKIERLWQLHAKAENMLLAEIDRRRRRAQRLRKAEKALENPDLDGYSDDLDDENLLDRGHYGGEPL